MEQTFYSVSMIFVDASQTGLSVRCLWARNEEEAFGIAYDLAKDQYKGRALSMKLVVPTEFTREKPTENEIHNQ